MDTAIGIIIIVAIIGIFVVLSNRGAKKRKEDTWTGSVVKKWISRYTDEDGDTTETPMIQVQKDDGKKKKYAVSAATYNSLSAGDKVKKDAGQMDPVKA